MSDSVRRVLRRKRHTVLEHLDVDKTLLERMLGEELIDADTLDWLMGQPSEQDKQLKLLEILQNQSADDFLTFCQLLPPRVAWLSEELSSEMQEEDGSLTVEGSVQQEAEMMVHKHFGTSRRLSEVDKKKISKLIGMKTQAAKDMWKRQLEKTEADLAVHTEAAATINKTAFDIEKKIEQFLRQYSDLLYETYHSMYSTSECLQLTIRPFRKHHAIDRLTFAEERLDFLLRRAHMVMAETRALMKEREKCLKLLGTFGNYRSLEEAITAAFAELWKGKESYERQIRGMNQRLSDIEELVNQREATIEHLQTQIEAKEQIIRSLEASIAQPKPRNTAKQVSAMSLVGHGIVGHTPRDRPSTTSTHNLPQIPQDTRHSVTKRWLMYGSSTTHNKY